MHEVVSFLEFVNREMKDNVYNLTKDGKCTGCGACCSNLLPLSQKEIREIRRYIKKHHVTECLHAIPQNVVLDMTCPFLDESKSCDKCKIYDVRPMICRKFICDSEQRAKLTRSEVWQTRRVVDVRAEFFGKENG